MLLILFGAPKFFDRYYIRSDCEIFREGNFCNSKDVTSLQLDGGITPSDACMQYTFPVDTLGGCPAFKEPSEASVAATGVCRAAMDTAESTCAPYEGAANAVRTFVRASVQWAS